MSAEPELHDEPDGDRPRLDDGGARDRPSADADAVAELERRVVELERRYFRQAQILAAVRQAVVVTDGEGRVTYWNAAAEERCGWTREEAVGRFAVDLVVTEESRREAAVMTDMSEQKEAERRRAELIRALEHERSRLESVFRQAPAFMAVLRGPDHVFELANPAYRALVGDRDLLGLPLAEAVPEAREQGTLDLLDGVRKSGRPWVGREVRMVLRTPEDRDRELHCNLVYQPITDVDGEVRRIVVHGVDVTDLVRERQRAEEASRAKNDFLATVSHELRTPLNAIQGYVDLMELGVPVEPPEGVKRYLERVRLSASHLQHLIEEVLALARLEAEHGAPDPEPVSPEDLGAEVRAIMEPIVRRKGLRLRVEADGLPDRIVSDPRKLRQIVVNLAGNAAKFTEAGSVGVTLSSSEEGHLLIRVEDTGPGIAEEDLEHLFEPFWQGRNADDRDDGAGLGLNLARRLTRMLGGEIRVESEVGVGSVFTVDLPLETPADARA